MTDDEIRKLKDKQQAEEILDILSNTMIKVPRYRTVYTMSGRPTYKVIVGIDEIPAAEYYHNKHNGGNNDED
jgi:hypothetical protein